MGFFDFLKPKQEAKAVVEPVNKQEENLTTPTKHNFDWFSVPSSVDGIPKGYSYQVSTENLDLNTYERIQESGEFELSAVKREKRIELYWGDFWFAEIKATHYVEIISDFMKKCEPIKVYACAKNTVLVILYRDKKKGLSNREFSVVKLTSYKGREKQEEISCLDSNDDVSIDEENGEVSTESETIGKLPKAILNRVNEEGCYMCFFDHYDHICDDFDMDKEVYVPYIKIYW